MNMTRLLLLLVALVGACAPAAKPAAVAPPEIPALIAQAQREPRNAARRFRLAAALAAARRSDCHVQRLRRAAPHRPRGRGAPCQVPARAPRVGRADGSAGAGARG